MSNIVAFFCPTARGGHPRYCYHVLKELVSLDNEFVFKYYTSIDSEFSSLDGCEVEKVLPVLIERKIFKNKLTWIMSRLFHYLKRDLIFIIKARRDCVKIIHLQEYSISSVWLILFIAKIFGISVCITAHNVIPHNSSGGLLIKLALKLFYKLVDEIVVHGNYQKSMLINKFGISESSVNIAYHGVWRVNKIIHEVVKVSEKKKILFYGSIRRNKGLHHAIKAVSGMSDCILSVYGAVEDSEYFAEIFENYKNNKNILFNIGFVPDNAVEEIFLSHDAIILPYENFHSQSGVLFDAINYGLPILSSGAGVLREAHDQFNIGEVFDLIDMNSISIAIKSLKNKSFYVDGFSDLCKFYSWESHAGSLIKSYRKII